MKLAKFIILFFLIILLCLIQISFLFPYNYLNLIFCLAFILIIFKKMQYAIFTAIIGGIILSSYSLFNPFIPFISLIFALYILVIFTKKIDIGNMINIVILSAIIFLIYKILFLILSSFGYLLKISPIEIMFTSSYLKHIFIEIVVNGLFITIILLIIRTFFKSKIKMSKIFNPYDKSIHYSRF